jgi:NAD(P)H-hydrate epimerase
MTAAGFLTAAGVEVPAITTKQMREVDRLAIEEGGPNLYQMMENAGRSLALTAIDLLGAEWRSVPIVVLAGTGGNGGGGICAARHLANRGADVTVAVTSVADLGPVPASQLQTYLGTPGRFARLEDLDTIETGLVIDAIIGYSLGGAPRGAALDMIGRTAAAAPVVALDVPSGIDSTTGSAPGDHVTATRTLTLALPKTGLDAPAVGDLWLADIGIPAEVYRRAGIPVPRELFGADYLVRLRTR